MHKAYRRTVGTVILKIESVDKLQSQHVENLYDNKHNSFTESNCAPHLLSRALTVWFNFQTDILIFGGD